MALLAAIWVAMFVIGPGPRELEVIAAVNLADEPFLRLIAKGFTALGEWHVLIPVSLAAGLWLVRKRLTGEGLILLSSTLLERSLRGILKIAIGRPRPPAEFHLVPVHTLAFPSGHAADAMLVYPLCALLLAPRRWRMQAVSAAVVLAVCIGCSRVFLGVHWPSDVVGGWCFGLFWLLGTLILIDRQRRIAADAALRVRRR